MVVWSLRIIDRFGKLVVTIAVTILVVLASFAVTYFDSILFDHNIFPAVYLSILTPLLTDIPQMTSDFVENVPLSDRQENCIPFAAIRWHDFGNRPAIGRPFGRFSCHPDTPLVSQSPCRRFPRPTPERVFVANHQSGPRFSGTKSSAPPPRPIGT